jgi:prepilin-type N-terminal cleavage/methylation domain-containing protein
MNTAKKLVAGFTLIEIVVVITLIGILATAGMSFYNEGRKLARDERRAADIKQLQIAIEAYKDAYGVYPTPGCGNTDVWMGPGTHSLYNGDPCDEYIDGLVPEFIAALPLDPVDEYEDSMGFIYQSDGTDYKVLVNTVESKFIESYEDNLARCPRSCVVERPTNHYCSDTAGEDPKPETYGVYSAGAICW